MPEVAVAPAHIPIVTTKAEDIGAAKTPVWRRTPITAARLFDTAERLLKTAKISGRKKDGLAIWPFHTITVMAVLSAPSPSASIL